MGNSDSLKQKLEGFIMTPNELAEKMESGKFTFYQPVDIKALEQEAIDDGMTSELFRMVVFHHLRERFVNNRSKTKNYSAHEIYNV